MAIEPSVPVSSLTAEQEPEARLFKYNCKYQRKDNEVILQLQEDYILLRCFNSHKDSQTEKELFLSMKKCAKRFIYSEQSKKGFSISLDDVEFKSAGAAAYVMEQFIKRPEFRLGTPSAYIRLRVLAELYRHKKIDEVTSFTDLQELGV